MSFFRMARASAGRSGSRFCASRVVLPCVQQAGQLGVFIKKTIAVAGREGEKRVEEKIGIGTGRPAHEQHVVLAAVGDLHQLGEGQLDLLDGDLDLPGQDGQQVGDLLHAFLAVGEIQRAGRNRSPGRPVFSRVRATSRSKLFCGARRFRPGRSAGAGRSRPARPVFWKICLTMFSLLMMCRKAARTSLRSNGFFRVLNPR